MSSDNQSSEDGTAGLEDMLNENMAQLASEPTKEQLPAAAPPPPPVPTPQPNTRPGNEIFAENSVKKVSRQDAAKEEFGFEIPVDAVPLPSGGKLYEEGHPLHRADHVQYRGMTAQEEDILMSQALIKKGTVITELIKSCLIDKSINVNSLVSGDRNALMVAIRISGYGQWYEPTFVCPECSHKNDMRIDLAGLNIKPLSAKPVSVGQNIFAFVLPVSKLPIEFKFLTGNEEEAVMKSLEAKKKRGIQNNNLVTTRLMSSLVSVKGDTSPGTIAKFVSAMPARDSLVLRQYIDKHEPGVDMEVEFICSNCDYFDDIQLPMGSSFFWPGA